MADLAGFAKRMNRIAVQVEGNAERAVKDCAHAAFRAAVEATPVDTGLARSNWTPQLDRAFEGLVPARVPGTGGSTAADNAAATIEAGAPAIESFDIRRNRSIHIANNAPHIRRLNDGHSGQAPAGFVQTAVIAGLRALRRVKVIGG